MIDEFIYFYVERLERNKLHLLTQNTSVVEYPNKFLNTILTIPVMTDGDRFRMGLKQKFLLEVIRVGKTTFDEASKRLLGVNSSLYGIGIFSGYNQKSFRIAYTEGPVPMEN